MDKRVLLQKLEQLQIASINDFKDQPEIVSWANRIAPILERINPQYYANFIGQSFKFSMRLSSDTLLPAFNIMHSQVEMAIEELKLSVEAENSLQDQFYFPANSQLDIQRNIARIITQARSKLWISDGYMDEKIIEELTNVIAPEIWLLTKQPKSLFKQRFIAAQQQFSGDKKIEAKLTNDIHDRFFIIDEDQVWNFGTSYNNAGNLPTTITKIKPDVDRQKIISDFSTWWHAAKQFI
jgi:hypothetical protein